MPTTSGSREQLFTLVTFTNSKSQRSSVQFCRGASSAQQLAVIFEGVAVRGKKCFQVLGLAVKNTIQAYIRYAPVFTYTPRKMGRLIRQAWHHSALIPSPLHMCKVPHTPNHASVWSKIFECAQRTCYMNVLSNKTNGRHSGIPQWQAAITGRQTYCRKGEPFHPAVLLFNWGVCVRSHWKKKIVSSCPK